MRFFELDPLTDPRWEQLVRTDSRSSVFHTTGWLWALKHTYGYVPVVVTTTSPSAPLTNGILFCRVSSFLTGKRLVSLPFSDHCHPLCLDDRDAGGLLAEVAREQPCWKYLEIRPRWPFPSEVAGVFQCSTEEYFLHSLDLCKELDSLLKSFHHSSIQRKISRAKREQIEYEEGRSKRMIRQFAGLFVPMRKRRMLPPPPIQWFENLADFLGENFKVRVASTNGRPIASIITLTHRKTMFYKYACSDPAFQNLGGMAFLIWKSIMDAKELNLNEFDFGRTDLDDAGLIQFKDRWGTTRTPLSYWRWPPGVREKSKRKEKTVVRIAQKILALGPDFLFSMAGRMMYRHIG